MRSKFIKKNTKPKSKSYKSKSTSVEINSSKKTLSKRKAEKQTQIISDDDLYDYSYNEDETLNDILNKEDSDITVQSIESSISLTSHTNTLNETISNTNIFSSNILNENTSKKLRKKGTSWVWQYMEICQNKVICLECQKSLPSNQTQITSFQLYTGTGNMIQHLLTIHQINEFTGSQNIQSTIQLSKQQKLTLDLIDWIIDDMQPFTVIKNKKFQKLINNLESEYQIPAISTIKNIMFKAVQQTKEQLKQCLSSATISASFTTDEWTSNHKPYIGVTIHWISADFKLHQALLSLEENLYPHTAINLFHKLKSIFEQFNIENKFIAGVTDNAPNIVAAMKNFKNIKHIRCAAHTIQISVRKGIEEINSLVTRISNLNKFLVNHDKYREKLKIIQQNNRVTDLTILNSFENSDNEDINSENEDNLIQQVKIVEPIQDVATR
jgi:hypothetical protein